MTTLETLALAAEDYISLLRKLISVSEHVQNAPSLGLVPHENLVSDFVLQELAPYVGATLSVERVEFVPGRGNVILKYTSPRASPAKTLAFVGAHLDVVPANPEAWVRDPFTLTVEGDKLYGRGTTDCLGHVALLTLLFRELAKHAMDLTTQIIGVLIASEENSEIEGVGVETLMAAGHLDCLKRGPVLWLDCSDSQPCIGTAGAITWSLHATGKLFHSGLPHLGINSLELAMDAMAKIQAFFYQTFPALAKEREYNYACPSTMKPTRMESSLNGLNQIPAWTKIAGDVRLSPFYDMQEMIATMTAFVEKLNGEIASLEGARGPVSKYALPDEDGQGTIALVFDKTYYEGIACSLDSIGYNALLASIETVLGAAKPFSISGSLPLVRNMQRSGFDLTLVGFGKSAVYHGDNEYCLLSDMQHAMQILALTIANVEKAEA